jgi:anti-sigma factor RsiW
MSDPHESRLRSRQPIELVGHADLAFGSSTEAEARALQGHIERCPACQALLASDEEIRRRLALLRHGEPRIDVLEDVMRQINSEPP